MQTGLHLHRTSRDDEFDDYEIVIADDASRFVMSAYIAHQTILEIATTLSHFASTVEGSTVVFQLGRVKPMMGGAAVHVTLVARARGQIFLTAIAESQPFVFDDQEVVDRGSAHLISEPVLVDNFVISLLALMRGDTEAATLEAR